MVQKKYLKEILNEFLKKASKKIIIDRFILFGSRAGRKFREDSDVDLMIISDDFEGMNFFERVSKMYNYWDFDLPVDFLCYTTKEFNLLKKRVSIVNHALKEGIIIK